MPTLADVERHQTSLLNIATLAIDELVRLWRQLDPLGDPAETAAILRDVLPSLLEGYALAAGSVAADFYDDLRAEVAALSAYTAMAADPPPDDLAEAVVSWGIAPLFWNDTAESDMLAEEYGVAVAPKPAPDPEAALSRLSAGVQRAVANTGRDTIITNTRRDPSAVRYFRHASANACAFCAMLATRQAAYVSEESAGTVVFERRRNKRALGEKYHNNCHCVPVPVWPGQEVVEAPYVAQWREAYYAATEEVGNSRDTKAILAAMRQGAGLR